MRFSIPEERLAVAEPVFELGVEITAEELDTLQDCVAEVRMTGSMDSVPRTLGYAAFALSRLNVVGEAAPQTEAYGGLWTGIQARALSAVISFTARNRSETSLGCAADIQPLMVAALQAGSSACQFPPEYAAPLIREANSRYRDAADRRPYVAS